MVYGECKMNEKFKNKKYVFFDFDGTLVDSVPALFDIYSSFLKRFGKKGNREEFEKKLNGLTISQIGSFLKRKYDLLGEEGELLEQYEQEVVRIYREIVTPFPSTENVLMNLKRKKNIALVTSAKEKCVRGFIERLEWEKYFNFLVFGDNIRRLKPNPEIYNVALERARISSVEGVVIEDSSNGVKSAKNAGIRVIGVSANRAYRQKLNENGADVVVSDLSEILPILI